MQRQQRAGFTASLSARDRAAFCSGHRLDPGRRDQLLADLAPGVAKNRMWRFSDEPAFAPVGPAAEAAAQVRRAGPAARPAPRAMRAETILMDLWHESEDPEFLLELESCVDAITNGANFLFDGDRSAAVFQQNHGSARRNHAELVQAVERAVAKGHRIGPFPFPPLQTSSSTPSGSRRSPMALTESSRTPACRWAILDGRRPAAVREMELCGEPPARGPWLVSPAV